MSFPLVPSNISALYTPRTQQTIIRGRLAGRKKPDLRAASAVSRRGLRSAAAHVIAALGMPALERAVRGGVSGSYSGFKGDEMLRRRRTVKTDVTHGALQGWGRNAIDDFGLEL